jgi:hypothetical protein
MGNVIKRNSVFIEAVALTDSSAFRQGEQIGNFKQDGRWIAKDQNGKKWVNLVANLRNEHYFRFVRQFSMADLVCSLQQRNADYHTVMPEQIEDVIRKTFDEANVRCLDDIYEYVSAHLL